MTPRSKFNDKIRAWLLPLGYVEIYRINHPTDNKDEVHFIKDCIRVVCQLEFRDESFHLHSDIIAIDPALAIITCKYPLESSKLESLHNYVFKARCLLVREHACSIMEDITLEDI